MRPSETAVQPLNERPTVALAYGLSATLPVSRPEPGFDHSDRRTRRRCPSTDRPTPAAAQAARTHQGLARLAAEASPRPRRILPDAPGTKSCPRSPHGAASRLRG